MLDPIPISECETAFSCTFYCAPGWSVHIEAAGAIYRATADCGGQTAECISPAGLCKSDAAFTAYEDTGSCTVASGVAYIKCYAY